MRLSSKLLLMAGIGLLSIACKKDQKSDQTEQSTDNSEVVVSQLGDTLVAPAPSEKLLARFEEKKAVFEADPNLENTIWYGRFMAYIGNYREAIAIYTEGLERFPDNSRLLRHRGHRYITVREFERAIQDLEKARQLIQGKENMIEQDGMPNAQNIPVSTMHGNIYYHLGLAYYLDRQLPKALEAYKTCLKTSRHADNVVSATHWIYMIQNRMSRKQAADNYLRNITTDMNVIENHTYYKACLFYKGLISEGEAIAPDENGNGPNSAMKYALGNYYYYNGQHDLAEQYFDDILSGDDWNSFGYIAAETEKVKPYIYR